MDAARAALLALIALLLFGAGPEQPHLEQASAAFKQKRYAEATKSLQRAMRLNPGNDYTADFLATTYLLRDNLPAALKYWNRIGKPHVEELIIQPGLRMDPVILDRAFAFAPGGTLQLHDHRTTRARLDSLGVFQPYTLRLDARDDGKFDAVFEAAERNGFGGPGRLLVSSLRGVFYQAVQPEYFNIAGSATNISSLLRWDAQKRRATLAVSGPLRRHYRYTLAIDGRNENWEFRTGKQPVLAATNLRRTAVASQIASVPGADWSWSAGVDLSHRDLRNVLAGSAGDALLEGYQLKQTSRVARVLWRQPERRFESDVSVVSDTARVWAAPSRVFQRLQAELALRTTREDYAFQHRLRAGRVWGRAPFDELYVVGLERDTGAMMRAHAGTHDGRKGSAPLARQYFVANWEIDKKVFGNRLMSVHLSPFLDAGIARKAINPVSTRWMFDTGAQLKVRLFGAGVTLIYGKDLRTGNNIFYVMPR